MVSAYILKGRILGSPTLRESLRVGEATRSSTSSTEAFFPDGSIGSAVTDLVGGSKVVVLELELEGHHHQ